jgi:hypothetical protein
MMTLESPRWWVRRVAEHAEALLEDDRVGAVEAFGLDEVDDLGGGRRLVGSAAK